MKYEMVVGLEIHAQLKTNTKIFCSCPARFGDEHNTNICPVCMGLPGALPVLNRSVVDMAIRAGLATGCTINHHSVFARKNYFYPDLPKGYQISQYDLPICEHGHLDVVTDAGAKRIGITRIHMEEDAGKLIHDQDVDSLFDVNRCGTPLIEIVSEPDMRTAAEAYEYLTGIKQVLSYLDVSDCNMEEGSLRCDVNISIRPFGQTKLGTKVELKNMNSFRNVEKAIEYEYGRQIEVIENGGAIIQQTYLWDPNRNITVAMRTKEDAHDYRYFPDPDLTPVVVTPEWIETSRASLPELPKVRLARFQSQYGLSLEHAETLTLAKDVADYFEAVVAAGADAKTAANWTMTDVLRIVKEQRVDIGSLTVTPKLLAGLIAAITAGTISGQVGKQVFDKMQETGKDAAALIKEMGLEQVSDTGVLEAAVQQVIDANPSEVERLKGGDGKLTGFFVGQSMKLTGGKGNPKEISAILRRLLGL